MVNGNPKVILSRINWKYGYLKSWNGGFGVSDVSRWIYGGINSTANFASNGNSGGLTLAAWIDNDLQIQSTVPKQRVDFTFNYDLTDDGTWNYDYGCDDTTNPVTEHTHEFDDGNFAAGSSGYSKTSMNGGDGIGSPDALPDLGVGWIYYVYDAYDFVYQLPSHPSQYNYGFAVWDSEYILRYMPRA